MWRGEHSIGVPRKHQSARRDTHHPAARAARPGVTERGRSDAADDAASRSARRLTRARVEGSVGIPLNFFADVNRFTLVGQVGSDDPNGKASRRDPVPGFCSIRPRLWKATPWKHAK